MIVAGPVIGLWLSLVMNNPGAVLGDPYMEPKAYAVAKRDPAAFCEVVGMLVRKTIEDRVSLPSPPTADYLEWNGERLTCPRDGSAPSWSMQPGAVK